MRGGRYNGSVTSCLNFTWSDIVIFGGCDMWQMYTANPRAFTQKCF